MSHIGIFSTPFVLHVHVHCMLNSLQNVSYIFIYHAVDFYNYRQFA